MEKRETPRPRRALAVGEGPFDGQEATAHSWSDDWSFQGRRRVGNVDAAMAAQFSGGRRDVRRSGAQRERV